MSVLSQTPKQFLSEETEFYLSGPAGRLQVVTSTPKLDVENITAIICHPHPVYGGTLKNKVVTTLNRAFKEMGIRTVRFNFRGVAKSEGEYDHAVGEVDDLYAVLRWVQQVRPHDQIWLAGFSFGTYIATKVATQIVPAQLVCVAPAVEHFDFANLPPITCPLLVVQGDADEVVPPKLVYDWVASLSPKPTLIRLAGASHFFHGRLLELREQLISVLHAE